MAIRDPERLKKLLLERRRQKRAAGLVEQWALHDVSASRVAQPKCAMLADRLRAGRSSALRQTNDLLSEVLAFVAAEDVVAVVGWYVEEEPVVLVSADRLMANVAALNRIYPDGFVLIREASGQALLVDFDDNEGTHVNTVGWPSSSR